VKIVKGLAVGLLGFLLFLSLSLFGLAFMTNSTVLNSDFVTTEIDKLDVSSLVEEVIIEHTPEEEFETALINTIAELEPTVKEQLGAAIDSVYDYLLGKRESPDLALTLRNTILSSDFIVSLVDELDISSLAREYINEQLIEDIPGETEYLVEYLDKSLDDIITELTPEIKEELIAVTDPIADYLLGERQTLNVVISLEAMMESIEGILRETFLESPPADLAHLSPAELEQYFDEHFEEWREEIPSTIELDESVLGTETPANIAEGISEAEEGLEQARKYIGYFQLGYKLLIVFIVLLIAGIILLNREVRSSTRRLGTTFLSCGIPWLVATLVSKHFAGGWLASLDIPSSIQEFIPEFVNDFLAPMLILSIVFVVIGVALIIVSVMYKRKLAD
jgi:hypothetical protein